MGASWLCRLFLLDLLLLATDEGLGLLNEARLVGIVGMSAIFFLVDIATTTALH